MSKDEESLAVKDVKFVNDETLELLRRRIESDVKRNFWLSIGGPVGAGGIVAFLLALFVWLPKNIDTYLADNEDVQNTITTAVKRHLENKEGEKFVFDSTREYLADPNSGRKVLRDIVNSEQIIKAIGGITVEYLSDPNAGQEDLKRIVYSAEMMKEIREIVKKELEPTKKAISKNSEQTVSSVQGWYYVGIDGSKPNVILKRTTGELDNFLKEPGGKAEELKKRGKPMAIAISIGGGHYTSDAISYYLKELDRYFGDKFQHVLITKFEGYGAPSPLLALVYQKQILDILTKGNEKDKKLLIDRLNVSSGEFDVESVKKTLVDIFGHEVVLNSVNSEWTIAAALREPIWDHKFLPVVNNRHEFIGTTTRDILLAAVFPETSIR